MHWLGRHRRFVLAAIGVSVTAFVLLARLLTGVPFVPAVWIGEEKFEDFLQKEGRKTATRDDFVFLGIDQSTLQMPPLAPEELENNRAFQLMTERPYPWSREVWALLLDRLFGAGAKLVMFDLLFSSPNDGDPAFRAALDRYRDRVVIGANIDFSAVREEGGAAQMIPPNGSLIPVPQMEDNRVGFVNFFPDPLDQKVRAALYSITDRQLAGYAPEPGEQRYASFGARGLEKMGQANAVPHDLQAHLIRFGSPNAYAPRPLYEVFDRKILGRKLWERRILYRQGHHHRRFVPDCARCGRDASRRRHAWTSVASAGHGGNDRPPVSAFYFACYELRARRRRRLTGVAADRLHSPAAPKFAFAGRR